MVDSKKREKQMLQDRYWAKKRIARFEKKIRVRERKPKFAEKKAKADDRPLLEKLEAVPLEKRGTRSRQKRDEISNLLFMK